MTNKIRDEHLATLLPAEVLKELDDAERNVLYDEFSNADTRNLGSQGIEVLRRRISGNLKSEYQRRLSHISASEYKTLKPWYEEVCKSVEEIYCLKCGALEAIQVDTIDDSMNEHHHEGKFVVAIGDALMSYRPRLDGVMGFLCGNIIPVPEELKEQAQKEYDERKEARRAALIKDLSERLPASFEERKPDMLQSIVDEPLLPKIKTKAQAEKYLKLQKPSKKDIEHSVNVVISAEFPELEFNDVMECGNNTLWSQIELDTIPQEHGLTTIPKEDIVKLKQKMDETSYSPDMEETKSGLRVETFELRKVK